MEILVGISVLLAAIAGVTAYFQSNSKSAKRSAVFYQATALASAAIETAHGALENRDSLDLILKRIGDSSFTRNTKSTQAGVTYALRLKYRKVGAPANLMAIQAMVTWGDRGTNTLGTVVPYEP